MCTETAKKTQFFEFNCPLAVYYENAKKKKKDCCKAHKKGDRCKKCPGRK